MKTLTTCLRLGAYVIGLAAVSGGPCRAGDWLSQTGGSVSGAWHSTGGAISGGAKHTGSMISGGAKHTGSMVSNGAKHTGSMVSAGTKHTGGMLVVPYGHYGTVASGISHHAGGVASGMTHHAATALGNTNPEVKKFLKGPGVNENTTFRETYQGAGQGGAEGAGVGFVLGGPPGAAIGAVSGAMGGAAVGLGQGVFDTNQNYFLARDRTKNVLPSQYKPNTYVRTGYQQALKAGASAVVGDLGVSQIGADNIVQAVGAQPGGAVANTMSPVVEGLGIHTDYDPEYSLGHYGKDFGKAGAAGAAQADWTSIANALRQQANFERQGLSGADAGAGRMNLSRMNQSMSPVAAFSLGNDPRHAAALRNSVSALQRTGHTDPRRPTGSLRPAVATPAQ